MDEEKTSDSLSDYSSTNSNLPLQQLLNMIIGHLSGTLSPIMSSAVSALSLLIYKNQSLSLANEIIPWSSVSKNHFTSKVVTIFEIIIIRKCGYSFVETYVPDRYRGFIKNVKEQRRKTSSKMLKHMLKSQINHFLLRQGRIIKESLEEIKRTQTKRENKRGKFSRPNKNGPNKFGVNDRGKWVSKDKNSDSGGSRKPNERNKRLFSGGKDNFRQQKESGKTTFRKSGSNSKFRKR